MLEFGAEAMGCKSNPSYAEATQADTIQALGGQKRSKTWDNVAVSASAVTSGAGGLAASVAA